jgi:hypothetical protein
MKAAQILLAAYPATADIFYSRGGKGKFYTVQEAQVNITSLKKYFQWIRLFKTILGILQITRCPFSRFTL